MIFCDLWFICHQIFGKICEMFSRFNMKVIVYFVKYNSDCVIILCHFYAKIDKQWRHWAFHVHWAERRTTPLPKWLQWLKWLNHKNSCRQSWSRKYLAVDLLASKKAPIGHSRVSQVSLTITTMNQRQMHHIAEFSYNRRTQLKSPMYRII